MNKFLEYLECSRETQTALDLHGRNSKEHQEAIRNEDLAWFSYQAEAKELDEKPA